MGNNTIFQILKDSWIVKMLTSNRFKSLYWRIAGQASALLLMEMQTYITELHPDWKYTVLLGLIISEVTKYLNKSNPPMQDSQS